MDKFSSRSKAMYSWDEKYGPRPADFNDYYWLVSETKVYGEASQQYVLELLFEPSHGGILYKIDSQNSDSIHHTKDENTAYTNLSVSAPGFVNRNEYVYILKFPKDQVEQGDELACKITATINGVDGAKDQVDGTNTFTWINYEFTWSGNVIALSKSGSLDIDGALLRLQQGLDVPTDWQLQTIVQGYDLEAGYAVEVTDDYRRWRVEGENGYIPMDAGDLYIPTISIQVNSNIVDRDTGELSYPAPDTYNLGFEVMVLTASSGGEYYSFKTGTLLDDFTSDTNHTFKYTIEPPEDTLHVQVKLSGCEDYTKMVLYVSDVVKASSPQLDRWFSGGEQPTSIRIENYGMTRLYDCNGVWLNGNINENSYDGDQSLIDWDRDYLYHALVQRAKAGVSLKGAFMETNLNIIIDNVNNNPTEQTVSMLYTLIGSEDYHIQITAEQSEQMIANGWEPPARNAMRFYDLLPLGCFYDESYVPQVKDTINFQIPVNHVLDIETIDNYKGTGRQMVIFKLEITQPNWTRVRDKFMGTGAAIRFRAVVPWENVIYANNAVNLAAYQTANAGEAFATKGAHLDDGNIGNADFASVLGSDGKPAFADLRGDGIGTTKDTAFAKSKRGISVPVSMTDGLIKQVYAPNSGQNGIYSDEIAIGAGDSYDYRLQFFNTEHAVVGNVILFDQLEQANADNGADGWRGSLESIDLNYITAVGIAPVVYYSTQDNPPLFTAKDIKNGAVDTSWFKQAPDDLSLVRAIAVDLSTGANNAPFVFENKTGTTLVLHMRAPDQIPAQYSAYNSAAMYAEYSTAINSTPNCTTVESKRTEVQFPRVEQGNLSISKTVTGNAGDLDKEFTFTLTLQDPHGAPDTTVYNYHGSKTGSVKSGETITLKHGQTVTIANLPAGTTYLVQEEDYQADGYTTTSTGASGAIEANKTHTAAFSNDKHQSTTPSKPDSPDPKPTTPPDKIPSTPPPTTDKPDVPPPLTEIPDLPPPLAEIPDVEPPKVLVPKTGDTGMRASLAAMLLSGGILSALFAARKKKGRD